MLQFIAGLRGLLTDPGWFRPLPLFALLVALRPSTAAASTARLVDDLPLLTTTYGDCDPGYCPRFARVVVYYHDPRAQTIVSVGPLSISNMYDVKISFRQANVAVPALYDAILRTQSYGACYVPFGPQRYEGFAVTWAIEFYVNDRRTQTQILGGAIYVNGTGKCAATSAGHVYAVSRYLIEFLHQYFPFSVRP